MKKSSNKSKARKSIKSHTCKIVPLKKTKWFKELSDEQKASYVAVSQHLSNAQVWRGKDEKCFEIANPGQRAGLAGKNVKPGIFDIAISLLDKEGGFSEHAAITYCCLAILREKICNDLHTFEVLFETMGIKGDKITMDDVIQRLKNN